MDIKRELIRIIEGKEEINYIEEWEYLKKNVTEEMLIKYGVICIQKSSSSQVAEEYLNIVNSSENFSILQKYYLLNQINAFMFGDASFVQTNSIKKLGYRMYNEIYKKYLQQLNEVNWIDINERDEDLIFVTVQQFLNLNHGPTKTTLDRARVLKQRLNKRVIIINTAEMLGGEDVPLAVGFNVNYDSNLMNVESIEYEGEKFPYVQFDNNTPNIEAGKLLVEFVKKYKPSYIVNIGGNSLMVDVCANVVPVLNVNTVPSNISCTHATAQVVGKVSESNPDELLKIVGKDMKSVIFGRFTWSLKKQNQTLNRKELGCVADSFIIAVVGARLTTELDERFIKMIEPVLYKGAYVLIIGEMNNYEEMCINNSIFKQKTIYLGMQDDVLAILDNVDLYVNPDRIGGGTSVIEAMYKAIPVVTLDHGDVALGAGEEFCVHTYAEMTEKIIKYMNDIDYYNMMSKKAKERANYMLDSDGAFTDIISEFETKFCLK